MDTRIWGFLMLCILLSVSGGDGEKYCQLKARGIDSLAMCLGGSTSGSKVAVEASNITGNSCKCTLKRMNPSNPTFVIDVNYHSSSQYSHKVEFYIDGRGDQNKIRVGPEVKSFNTNSVELMADQETASRSIRRCLVFSLPTHDTGAKLNLTCHADKDDIPDFSRTVGTTTVDGKTNVKQTSSSPTSYSTVQRKGSADPKPATIKKSSDIVNSTIRIRTAETISEVTQESTTTSLKDSSTQSDGFEEKGPKENKSNITGIIAGVITAVVLTAVVVVVAVSIGVICYFKRRKRSTNLKESPPTEPNEEAEEEYEMTENAMYIPTVMVEQNKTEVDRRDSDHTYAEPGVDLKRYPDNLEDREPLLLEQSEIHNMYQNKNIFNNNENGQSNRPVPSDIDECVNGFIAVPSDDNPVYSQVDKSKKITDVSGENRNDCNSE